MLFGTSSFRYLTQAVVLVVLFAMTNPAQAIDRKDLKNALRKTKFDPTAEKVELFDGIKEKQVDYHLLMSNSKKGTLFIENTTDKPLLVEVPPAVVGVHVLAQFGNGGQGGGFGGQGGGGFGGQGGGQQQSFGGGGQGGGGQGGGFGGQGGGFGGGNNFSIPAKKMIAIKLKTVCLEHGKPEPSPKATFKLVKVEDYTRDARLHELLKLVATDKVNHNAAQAAAWHLASKMSWNTLLNKPKGRLGASAQMPYFSRTEMTWANNLVNAATVKARQLEEANPKSKEKKTETSSPRTSIRTLKTR